MVKRGFDDVTKNMAKQRDLDLVRVDVHGIKEKLENIEKQEPISKISFGTKILNFERKA